MIKKLIPAFFAAAVLISVLMVCLMMRSGKDENREVTETTDTAAHVSQTKTHVFHVGELRGVWVPYFSISDDEKPLDEADFKRRFDEIIKTCVSHGANAIFVHVRSHCDAAYPSELFPLAPQYAQGYDPLQYMVEAAHRSGLEFHAWINPYRINSNSTEIPDDSPCSNWANTRDVIEYDGGVFLNPASNRARSLIIDGVKEIVSNYDVDGIHLDDYFYAFTESGIDEADYREYTESVSKTSTPLPLDKWRCANVNVLVSGLYTTVKSVDEDTLFGISPQGNIENNAPIGADVYTWCGENGYIDYIAPQIYFNSENPVCPFEDTVDEWRSLIKADNVQLYIGLALYKAGSDVDDGTWLFSDNNLASQVKYTRSAGTGGFILYAYDYLESEQTKTELDNLELILGGS